MEPVISQEKRYSIQGKISYNDTGLSNITVTLSGAESQTTTTNDFGEYFFIAYISGDYDIAPISEAYTFAPVTQSITLDNENIENVNFSASIIIPRSISGNITLYEAALENVTVELKKDGLTIDSTMTDSLGNYTLITSHLGVHDIIPTKNDHTFTPSSLTINEAGIDIINQNFIAELNALLPIETTISGHVNINNIPQEGTSVYLRPVYYNLDFISIPGSFVPSGGDLSYVDSLVEYYRHSDGTASSFVWALSSAGMLTMLWLDGIEEGSGWEAPINIETSNDYTFMVSDETNIWLAGATDDRVVRFKMTELQYSNAEYDYTEFNHGQGEDAFNHGVYDPCGKVWFAPKNSSTILSINPLTYEFSTIAHGQTGTNLYCKAVSDGSNDAVWLVPRNASHIIRIDCINETISTIDFINATTNNFSDGLIVGEFLYLIPQSYNSVVKINLTTYEVSYIALPSLHPYYKGIFDNNGNIWMFSSYIMEYVNSVARLEISTGVIEQIDSFSEPEAVLQDNNIWIATSECFVKINVLTHIPEYIYIDPYGGERSNLVVVAEGKDPDLSTSNTVIYCIPRIGQSPYRLWRNVSLSSSPISTATNASGLYNFIQYLYPTLKNLHPISNFFVSLDEIPVDKNGIYVDVSYYNPSTIENNFNSYLLEISGEVS